MGTFSTSLPDGEIIFETNWSTMNILVPENSSDILQFLCVSVDFQTLFPHRKGLSETSRRSLGPIEYDVVRFPEGIKLCCEIRNFHNHNFTILFYNSDFTLVVYKSSKNSPNLTMTLLSVSKLKNSCSHSQFENVNFWGRYQNGELFSRSLPNSLEHYQNGE